MPRKDRIIYEGAIYHIYQRGNNKEFIFEDNRIKQFLLDMLVRYNKKFDYEILAYVIMENHYHILLKANKTPVDEIMFYINNVVAKYINNLLGRSGHAFENRYKCKLVETDGYLIWLLRYIHRNPVKANICGKVEQYRWSSHYHYMNSISSYVNVKFILNMFGENREKAVQRYLRLVNANGDVEDMNRDYEITEEVLRSYPLVSASVENKSIVEDKFIKPCRKTMQQIISSMRVSEGILTSIRNGKMGKELTPIKCEIARRALEECYTIKEISEYLNVVPSAISKLLSRSGAS